MEKESQDFYAMWCPIWTIAEKGTIINYSKGFFFPLYWKTKALLDHNKRERETKTERNREVVNNEEESFQFCQL